MKRSINFYQHSLKPKHDPLPLALMVKIIAGSCVLLVLVLLLLNWRLAATQEQLLGQQHKAQTLRQEVDALNKQLSQHRDVSGLEKKLQNLQKKVHYRLQLVDYLNQRSGSEALNYSEFMADLARYHNAQLWLTDIRVAAQHLQVQGQTSEPGVIAPWLSGLQQSPFFAGREFSVLEFEKQDELRNFKVSTELEGVQP